MTITTLDEAIAPGLGGVPIIDVSPFFDGTPGGREAVAAAVADACETIGFLIVTGHGVPQDSIDEAYRLTSEFFLLPMEEKMKIAGPEGDTYVAYSPKGDPYGKGADGPNLREVFHASKYDTPEEATAHGYPAEVTSSLPPNKWPEHPYGFEAAWKRYFSDIEGFTERLLTIFAVALDLPDDWFRDKTDKHLGTMAANCYVEQPVPPVEGQLRIYTHVDFSTLTILYQDDSPGGLQVYRRGTGWVDVPFIPGSYVVNLGDMMGRWTNDRWVATPHRVVNPPREQAMTRRISMPFFHLPNHDAVIEPIASCVDDEHPLKYVPIEAGEWIEARRAGRSANFGRIS